MKLFTLLANKKRAISPVISVILLIGLAVAAIAAIFIVVLPLLETTTNLQIDEAYIEYDDAYTIAADVGKGYGTGTLILSNAGTGEIEIVSLSVYYADSISLTAIWTEINETDKKLDITTDNPLVIAPLAALEELSVRFLIPEDNNNKTISYKITITTDGGDELDTAKVANVDETEMELKKDRPDISFTGTLDYVRRTQTISPTSVSDNSEIKNVTYQVYNSTWSITETITSSLWKWNWDTHDSVSNGTYKMSMTVNDFAGLSNTAEVGNFTIDNDYTPPTIGGLWITDPYPNNQTAEVGQSVSLTVEITDTGTEQAGASKVNSEEVFLYYRINGSVDTYNITAMNKFGTTNNWTTNIPSIDVDSTALENGIECYVSSDDIDGNSGDTSDTLKEIMVYDHYGPDIAHTPILSASSSASYINITTMISDEDQVNESLVTLYYRQTDDYGGITTAWNSISAVYSGNDYYWLIWSPDITIHGLDYFFNATDRFSGHVSNEGTMVSPHHISIPDEQLPVITHTAVTTATDNVDLSIDCTMFDTDPTFGASGNESGKLTIYYRDYDGGGDFDSKSMSRVSGNSSIDSNGETPSTTVWSGTIPASAIHEDGDPRLDYYIIAIDQTTNLAQNGEPFHITTVLPQKEPNLIYVADTAVVSGSIGEQVVITIENVLGSETDAEIGRLNLIIYSDSGFGTDSPELNLTKFASTTVWSNASGVANNTWVTFTENHTIVEGTMVEITMTFENSTNQPYDMHDLTFLLVLEAYSDFATTSTHELTIDLPEGPTPFTGKMFMTSGYSLSTTGTFNPIDEKGAKMASSLEWGIRVYVGGTELTTQLEAIVLPAGDKVWIERTEPWQCPQTALNPTDSITVAVIARAGATEQTMAAFSTGALGATELSASTWSINYWVKSIAKKQQYEPHYGFGDVTSYDSYDSFIDNFDYVTSA